MKHIVAISTHCATYADDDNDDKFGMMMMMLEMLIDETALNLLQDLPPLHYLRGLHVCISPTYSACRRTLPHGDAITMHII